MFLSKSSSFLQLVRLLQQHQEDTVCLKINWEQNREIARALNIKVWGQLGAQRLGSLLLIGPTNHGAMLLFSAWSCDGIAVYSAHMEVYAISLGKM